MEHIKATSTVCVDHARWPAVLGMRKLWDDTTARAEPDVGWLDRADDTERFSTRRFKLSWCFDVTG
jgi:hypothetical protein